MPSSVIQGALATCLWACAASAQEVRDPGPGRMTFTRDAMRLDGAFAEPVWAAADSITDFTQSDPDEGRPASERTVVRVVGDPDGLWIGVWAYDRDPGAIRRAQLRRDAWLGTDDHFMVTLSPTADKRTGFLFGTNANGARYDAEIVSFEDESEEWDAIWDVRARVTGDGWQAEFFIPWQTLRYRPVGAPGADAWDVNFGRYIRRKNEIALWRAWRRSEGMNFLERAGSLTGFAAAGTLPQGLPRRAIAELRPYVTATREVAQREYAPDGSSTVLRGGTLVGDAGLDAKLAPAPTLTLDVTANADFAQAEVDRQVVNLTRFPLFFPEQRPFFTEGAGIFAFGRNEETMLFYSRRIGRNPDGSPAPLLGGARLTGRLGRQQVGLLATHTGGDADATDVVARVRRDVLGRGYLGAMATARNTAGRSDPAGGLDFNLPFIIRDQNLVLLGGVAADGGPTPGDATYGRFVVDYPNDHADIVARVERVGAGFQPELGFVRQEGILRFAGQSELNPRPAALGALEGPLRALRVRQLNFNVLEWSHIRHLDGRGLSSARYAVQPLGAEFESGDEFELQLQREYDVPDEAFELIPGAMVPAGRHVWDRVELGINSSSARPVTGDIEGSIGEFYSGRAWQLEGSLGAKWEPHVQAEVEYSRTRFRLPGGVDPGGGGQLPDARFTANEARLRVDVAASPRLNTTLFAQWDSESGRVALNARVRWTQTPGTDAYLVWNSAWPSDLSGGIPWRRPTGGALVAKYVRYFRM